jgi:hypothetical protein
MRASDSRSQIKRRSTPVTPDANRRFLSVENRIVQALTVEGRARPCLVIE